MNEEMENLFWELKQYLVQHSPKWDTLCDIEQYIIDLEKQLEEKDKIINETINFINMIKNETYQSSVEGICDTALEILERGKNVNSK